MVKMNIFVLIVIVLLSLSFAFAQNVPATKVYYFYSNGCSHCKIVADSGILDMVSEWENVAVNKYEISLLDYRDKYLEYVSGFGIASDEQGIPFLVIEQGGKFSYLFGDKPIINDLENSIKNFDGVTLGSRDSYFDNLTLGVVVVAALIDSINPCAFGVLLFLMAVLLSMGSAKRAFRAGMFYTFVIFLVYLMAGLGVMKILGSMSDLDSVKMVVGIIVLVGAVIEIKDFFWEGKGISLKIPTKARPLLEKYVHKGTLPAIFILGAIVALVELPCTGGIYLAILSLISESGVLGLTYLILYNFVFVLPLVFITFFIYRGTKVEGINIWVQNNKRYMRLAAGLVMILLAFGLIGWI
ncbi:MAG: cytochrome c biogenesis protein CcdA [archaeon]